ncbi:hypothetical protein O181_025836 [Austropuccinia psidii MF-1]|uniref:Uncharacterized protein n=1 Tax=Austropuccinia psidii MF-1 TaxID=1389203 RepID=A0A9Q3CJD4_9BASI|nr:hypothetical protein [Austropuccinia psidii MF-1]
MHPCRFPYGIPRPILSDMFRLLISHITPYRHGEDGGISSFSAVRAATLFATQPTLSLNQTRTLCVSIYKSLAFTTTNFFLLASMRESDLLFAVDAWLVCETYFSANSRIGYDCEPTSCTLPQFKACYKPQKSGKYYVRNYQKPLHVDTMHSFQVRSVQNVAFAYDGPLPHHIYSNSVPDAICELGKNVASCGSCRQVAP